jgi:two-component system, cell cycle sensor histidine kinase and response regulator CckA
MHSSIHAAASTTPSLSSSAKPDIAPSASRALSWLRDWARQPGTAGDYVIALVAVFAVAVIRQALDPVLVNASPLLIFVFPTVVAAMRRAPGAALAATVTSVLVSGYCFIRPADPAWLSHSAQQVRILVFLAVNTAIIALAYIDRRGATTTVVSGGVDAAQTVLDATDAAVVGINRAGAVATWNTPAGHLLGWTADDIVGLRTPFVPAHMRAQYSDLHRRALDGERIGPMRIPLLRKDGASMPCEVSLRAISDGSSPAALVLATIADASERRRLEEQLREAQKTEAVGHLAAGVAHDFNNQLTVIMGHAKLASAFVTQSHPVRRDLAEIVKAARNSAGLTRRLLVFSRRSAARVEPVDIAALVTASQTMLGRVLREDIAVSVSTPAEPMWIKGDPIQLEHILVNLAVNARDAMPEGGALSITVKGGTLEQARRATGHTNEAGEYVVVTVTDTGAGMTEQVKARLFEPFFTTKGSGGGTGLGLTIVQNALREMSGSIAFESEPGRGTTAAMYFPRVFSDGSAKAMPEPAAAPGGNETILLADNNSAVRRLVTRLLSNAGYTVLVAADGDEALQIARERGAAIDLLVTDVIMPGLDGMRLAERLAEETGHTRVLYISGYPDLPAFGDTPAPGGMPFIAKPFSPTELARAVRRALDA